MGEKHVCGTLSCHLDDQGQVPLEILRRDECYFLAVSQRVQGRQEASEMEEAGGHDARRARLLELFQQNVLSKHDAFWTASCS